MRFWKIIGFSWFLFSVECSAWKNEKWIVVELVVITVGSVGSKVVLISVTSRLKSSSLKDYIFWSSIWYFIFCRKRNIFYSLFPGDLWSMMDIIDNWRWKLIFSINLISLPDQTSSCCCCWSNIACCLYNCCCCCGSCCCFDYSCCCNCCYLSHISEWLKYTDFE